MQNENNKLSTISKIHVAIKTFKAEQTRTSKKVEVGSGFIFPLLKATIYKKQQNEYRYKH